MSGQDRGFSDVTERLNEITEEVASDDITLDEALKLYEEAVKLGLAACDLSELDIRSDEMAGVSPAEQGDPAIRSAEADGEAAGEDVSRAPSESDPSHEAVADSPEAETADVPQEADEGQSDGNDF